MFTLSVCLIVKNEEKVLARCLNCARQFADEIVVVDTGSTDSTKQIAKIFTQNVYNFKWVDDFSKARNFSFQKATCDFVMWLDADDVISKENIQKIIELKKTQTPADVYMLKYEIAFDENNNPTFSYFRERILRRKMNFFWEGFVHEAIVPRGKIEHLEISIEHRKIKVANPKRNLQLYNKKIKEGHVLSPREQFYYSRELFYNQQYKKCIKTLKTYLKNKSLFPANRQDAHKILAQAYIQTNKTLLAKNCLIDSLKFSAPSAEICCLLGNLAIKNSIQEAAFWFKCALNCEKNLKSGAFVEDQYYNLIPFIQLCYINYKLGNVSLSKEFHEKAKKINPKNPSVLYNDKFFKSLKI